MLPINLFLCIASVTFTSQGLIFPHVFLRAQSCNMHTPHCVYGCTRRKNSTHVKVTLDSISFVSYLLPLAPLPAGSPVGLGGDVT